jgi:predicted nucleotidyltransferase
MEIIKNTIKVGNSAGVLLPKKWLYSQVKIILEPLNIERDVIELLIKEDILKDVLGVYLVGSYARKEQGIESDIDIIAITSNISKHIKAGNYDINCITQKEIEEQLENNALPIIPMFKEGKPIINEELIKKYASADLTKKNIKYYIESVGSAMELVNKDIALAEKTNTLVSDASAYSLILRLRTIYIIECLKKRKFWKKSNFLKLIKKISGSLIAYERYICSKNKNTLDYKLPITEAKKLVEYINKENLVLEKWLKE